MAKAKARPKIDFKQLLLAKGEYFALGLAGLFTGIMLLSGISMWSSAQDPKKIATGLKTSADNVVKKINGGDVSPDDEKMTELPVWLKNKNEYKTVPVNVFPITGPQFDPIAKPDTKRDKPIVLPLLPDCQVDLVRIPFKAFDITAVDKDGQQEIKIGVITDKRMDKMDQKAREDAARKVKNRPSRPGSGQVGPGGFGPGGFGPAGFGPGGGQPGMGGPGGGRPPGMSGMGGMAGRPGSQFNANEQRTEQKVTYIPIDQLDDAMAKGMSPAFTVIPLRGVIIHMEVPYKRQLEEIKRALRLTSTADAMAALDAEGKNIYEDGRIYAGYEVQRRVLAANPEGKLEVNGVRYDIENDWPKTDKETYQFAEYYAQYISSRKAGDVPEDSYLANFIRPDMKLVFPLPELVNELGRYPDLKLPNINDAVDKLKKAGVTPKDVSDTLKRLTGGANSDSVFQNQSSSDTGAAALGAGPAGGPGMRPGGLSGQPMRPMGQGPGPMSGGNMDPKAVGQDVDYLLLRFVDVKIEKGKTYQYRIRLKMLNPNFTRVNDVSNPAYARDKYLYSQWTLVGDEPGIEIPPEDFVYALDVGAFRKSIEDAYQGNSLSATRERERFQAKDHQAVVEMCRWLTEVRPDTGRQREPVGTWVVADIPVGRGEYVGRKQFVKLPLWSSETKSYRFREVSAPGRTKSSLEALPKGWLIDFTSPDVLVDFSGGKVATIAPSGRRIAEDASSELLIVSPDGRLTIKKSQVDEADDKRQKIVDGWTKWIADVEKKAKEAKDSKDDPNGGFNAKPNPGM